MSTSPIQLDTQSRLLAEVKTSAGTTQYDFAIESDSVLVTLFASAVGTTLDVAVYGITQTADGQERLAPLFTFPTLTVASTTMLLRRASVATERLRVVATYGAGGASYEVYAKAIMAGLSDSRILGANSARFTQRFVTGTGVLLIAASLQDRAGIVLKNWSSGGNLFLGESVAASATANGYPLAPKDALAVDLAAGVALYGSADSGTIDVRIGESGLS